MKTYRNVALLLSAMLLLTFCQSAYAESDSERDVEIFVYESTTVYDASGETIGQLMPGESRESVLYQRGEDDAWNTARIFLQRSMTSQTTKDDMTATEGRYEIKIIWVAVAPEGEDDASATTNDTTQNELETEKTDDQNADAEIIESGWIDSDTVIEALIRIDTNRMEDIRMLKGEISALQFKNEQLVMPTPESNSGTEVAEEDPKAESKESTVNLLTIIILVLSLVSAAGIAWIIFNRKAKKNERGMDQETAETQEQRTSAAVNLAATVKIEWPENPPTLLIRHEHPNLPERALSPTENDVQRPNEGDTKENSEKGQEGNGIGDADEELPKPIEEQNRQCALELVNRLQGIRAKNLWQEKVMEAGFKSILLGMTDGSNPVFKETQSDSSYAAIWAAKQEEMVYIVPSYNDPMAERGAWSDYYYISNKNGEEGKYQITELAELSRQEGFFRIERHGKMLRFKQKEDF